MQSSTVRNSVVWLIVPVLACAFLVWSNRVRIERIRFVSDLPQWSVDAAVIDPDSSTGFSDERRHLIVPERNIDSYRWIAQTQQMFARGEWRVRRIDYENAPHGRDVHTASPYRWWLGLLAWFDHSISGRPIGASVEQAALYADSTLHILLLLSVAAFVAYQFGTFAAALVSLAIAGLFPFAAGFVPGMPECHGLARSFGLWSVLLLLPGVIRAPMRSSGGVDGRKADRGWFFLAGVVGGFGLWINMTIQFPVLLGVALGGIAAASQVRNKATISPEPVESSPPWRAWGIGAGLASAIAYLIEFAPPHVGLHLEVNHPFYAAACVGLGELLQRATGWIQSGRLVWTKRSAVAVACAVIAVAALPAAMVWTDSRGFWASDPFSSRLSGLLPVEAENVVTWISREGFTRTVWATILPLAWCIAAVLSLRGRAIPMGQRNAIAIAFGPVAIALVLAGGQLGWWSVVDVALFVLGIAATAGETGQPRRLGTGVCAALMLLAVIPGVALIMPRVRGDWKNTMTETDVIAVVERDLAHWLAARAGTGRAIVLAAPNVTSALCFSGGLRGVGTLDGENGDGLAGAIRIAGARSRDEALTLIRGRGITHIVMPTWDAYLDEMARIARGGAASVRESTFVGMLHRWAIPPWLRPVPYQIAPIAGFASHRVAVFEVVENEDPAIAASWLAEYFVELHEAGLAGSVAADLKAFPADIGALTALAYVEIARGNASGLAAAMEALLPLASDGSDLFLPWDRRVSFAVILARTDHLEVAREQMVRCLSEIDETALRSLTSGSLFNFLQLCKILQLEIADDGLRVLAGRLLPPAQRNRLR